VLGFVREGVGLFAELIEDLSVVRVGLWHGDNVSDDALAG
jgi:hypothetical protein